MDDATETENTPNEEGGVSPSYTVTIDAFSGPLEVLLALIEKRKLFVNDISLAEVCDDFIAYLERHDSFPLGRGSDFIYTAATLILIKSRSLLPTLPLTDEEEESVEDLEHRLRLYKRVQETRHVIRERFGAHPTFPGKGERFTHTRVFVPDPAITSNTLFKTALDVIERFPTEEHIPQTAVQETIKLETVVDSLVQRVSRHIQTSFREFSGLSHEGPLDKKKRLTVVVSFIAVLELMKQGIISAHQDSPQSDITMENTTVQVPRYN